MSASRTASTVSATTRLALTAGPRDSQTPLFHVIVPAPPEALAAAHQRFVERQGLELFLYPRPTTSPRCSRFEVTVGENAMDLDPQDVRQSLREVIRDAAG